MSSTTLATEHEVNLAIHQLANKLIDAYPQTPLFVALLKGAAPFTSKLMHAIAAIDPHYFPDLDYMAVSTYGESHEAGASRVTLPLQSDPSGRSVVVLDDVLDKGVTAEFATNYLRERGARDVKVVVLVRKDIERATPVNADYYCFSADDSWLYGMGMDDGHAGHEAHRWNADIKKVA